MIQSVIFDIDNTLYSYDDAHRIAFSVLLDYAEEKLGLSREEFTALHRSTQNQLKSRMGNVSTVHNRLIRYQNLLEGLGKPLHHALTMYHLYWNTLISASVPTEGAAEVMKELKKRGIRIGIGTDMTAQKQFDKLIHLELLEYVDFIVSSEEAQAEKPDAALFALCAEKAGCAAEDCLFVGDSLKKDVYGAQNAGMKGVWFAPMGGDCPEGVTAITRLTEILDLISR